MAKILKEKIINIERLAPDIFKMSLESEFITQNALPGQFVNIKCCEGTGTMLRRPISICSLNKKNKSYDIVFQIKGAGTELLSKKKAGEYIDLIGPLGNSFNLDIIFRKAAVIGGGIGVFPLLFVLKESKAIVKHTYLGFRNKDSIVLYDKFKKNSTSFDISTDDGSTGNKGLVTDLLERDVECSMPDVIYTCGPKPMIKKVTAIAEMYGIPCQVSMEERMGCGIGACLVCACKTKSIGDIPLRSGHSEGEVCPLTSTDSWKYSHVCKDGPIFWSNELLFDE
jgi:dihydroorotate dehydrogenase electron transfer subunit